MGQFQKLLTDKSGGVAVAFSFALPIVIGIAALGIDAAGFQRQEGNLQAIADTSALAVAKELHLYREKLDELREAGKSRVEAQLMLTHYATLPHSVDVRIDPNNNFIDVDITMVAQVLLPFGFWEENPMKVNARAMAYGQSRLCVLGLHESKSDTIKASAGSVLTAPECAVQSNSKHKDGLNVDSDSSIVSTLICSSGGVKGDGTLDPTPQTDCPQLEDPLSSREPPAPGGCDYLDHEIKGETVSISAGTYCGGLKITDGAKVTAEPGDYVFMLGKLEVKDSTFEGENVSLYFADDASMFIFDNDAIVDLTAPKEGPMAGILVYESTLATKGRPFEIKSDKVRRLLGTIYLPNGKFVVDTKGDVAAESAYTVIVAEQVEIKGANLVVNADYGGSDVPVPDGVGPNSSMVRLSR